VCQGSISAIGPERPTLKVCPLAATTPQPSVNAPFLSRYRRARPICCAHRRQALCTSANRPRGQKRVNACARQSTRRSGSGRRLLGRRWRRSRWRRSRSRRGRGGSRSRAWFTATVHHAHFSSAAFTDRGTHRGVPYANAIDQLTPQATSLANLNDRIVRLLKWDVRHTLCGGHNTQREGNDDGPDHLLLLQLSQMPKPMTSSSAFEHPKARSVAQ
jgi:hypothetical protein